MKAPGDNCESAAGGFAFLCITKRVTVRELNSYFYLRWSFHDNIFIPFFHQRLQRLQLPPGSPVLWHALWSCGNCLEHFSFYRKMACRNPKRLYCHHGGCLQQLIGCRLLCDHSGGLQALRTKTGYRASLWTWTHGIYLRTSCLSCDSDHGLRADPLLHWQDPHPGAHWMQPGYYCCPYCIYSGKNIYVLL